MTNLEYLRERLDELERENVELNAKIKKTTELIKLTHSAAVCNCGGKMLRIKGGIMCSECGFKAIYTSP